MTTLLLHGLAGVAFVFSLATFVAGASAEKDIERLVERLGSDEFEEREAASKALYKVGKPALKALHKAAKGSDDAEVRSRAAKLIAAIWDALSRPIDLGPHVNQKLDERFHNYLQGNDLAALPKGKQTFAGIKFTVGRGVVQLGAGKPDKVEGIEVGVKADKLQFLHACGHKGVTPLNTPIGKYVVRYEDWNAPGKVDTGLTVIRIPHTPPG